MNGYVPLQRRAIVVVAILAAIIVFDFVAVWSDIAEYRLLERIDAGEFVTDAEIDASDDRQATIGRVQLALFAATAIAFIAWFHRAYVNVVELGARELRFGTGWAIGAWFVPILNFWRPKQIANDIWRASNPELPPNPGDSWRGAPVPQFLLAWWLVFLFSGWVGASAAFASGGDTITKLKTSSILYGISDTLDAAAAALAVLVLWRTTARQEERVQRLALEQPPAERVGAHEGS